MPNPTKLLALLAIAGSCALAQEIQTNAPVIIPASAAKQHLDADAVVTGKVAEVNQAARLVRLNFDHPFPRQTFTAVIFANKTNLFPNLETLQNKTVEIRGHITDYRGRPEIILTSTNQLRVIAPDATAGPSSSH